MTVGDYKCYFDYLTNLNKFYNSNLMLMTITQKCKISDEIRDIKKLLNIKE